MRQPDLVDSTSPLTPFHTRRKSPRGPALAVVAEPEAVPEPIAGEPAAPALSALPAAAPPTREKKRRRQSSAPKHMTQEQVAALFRAIKDLNLRSAVRDLAMLRVAYHHGLRASEVGLLQLGDWHQIRGRIYIRRVKGSDSGEYVLPAEELRSLKAWLRKRGNKPGPLFASSRRTGISQQMLDKLVKLYAAAAGIPRELAHMHTLKHSCATHLFEMGWDVVHVKDWIGHRNIQNTMIYLKVTNKARDQMGAELKEWR